MLLTNSLGPAPLGFPDFPGTPLGIINWGDSATREPGWKYALHKWVARLRRRPYGSLRHLCEHHGFQYAAISQSNPQQLKDTLRAWKTELVITSGCPIIPMGALSDVQHGGINLHPSLLPAYRGGNPFFWQAYDCVEYTGCSVHELTASADAGDILGQISVKQPDGLDRNAWSRITEAEAGIPLLKQVVTEIIADTRQRISQPAASPTSYSNNFETSSLGQVIKPDEMSIRSLWNVVCFYGVCPQSLSKITGWRSWFQWQPAGLKAWKQNDRRGLTSRPAGIHWLLEIPAGVITLKPRLSLRHLLSKIIS